MSPAELALLEQAYEDDSIAYPDLVIADQLHLRLGIVQLAGRPFALRRKARHQAYKRALQAAIIEDAHLRILNHLARGLPHHPKHYQRPVDCPNCSYVFTIPADPRVQRDSTIV